MNPREQTLAAYDAVGAVAFWLLIFVVLAIVISDAYDSWRKKQSRRDRW